MLELPPLSLYVHIPWCVKKCPYCDFNSHEQKDRLPEQEYVAALQADLQQDLNWVQGRKIHSIFIGGGTPSLFSASAIADILADVDAQVGIASHAEITLEANPGTAEAGRFKGYRDAGVNRLSLGIQSFNGESLTRLGRIHDAAQAGAAISMARDAGFSNLNIDLMHGLPEQSTADALADLETALDYKSEHLSWYQLTIEPNTVFYRHTPPLPGESILEDIQEQGLALLEGAGFEQYEVSAYARAGKPSAHNLNYWLFGDYLGIGAGAHGKVTLAETGRILRNRKMKQPGHYLASSVTRQASCEEISPGERALEFMLNALRLRDGFTIQQFESRTGLAFSSIGKRVEYLQQRQLLTVNEHQVRSTDRGYQLLNSVLEEFM